MFILIMLYFSLLIKLIKTFTYIGLDGGAVQWEPEKIGAVIVQWTKLQGICPPNFDKLEFYKNKSL